MEISIDPRKYVVLDVETNGLKSKEDDLLSISLYKPDDRKIWNRFLPLELEKTVKTTYRNGITKEDLKDATPLTQKEFDEIIKAFELENRTILFYAGETGFDDIFLREYMRRKCIHGFEKLRFYNFKKQIISSKFSGGNVSKDTLCILFNIPNVTKIHTGVNDCRLEWELFQKLNGQYYLITQGQFKGDNVFRLSPDYIIPVSYLESHPNLGRVITNRPYIECDSRIFKTFQISAIGIKKFETNFNGMIIEHLLDVMLHAEKIDSRRFLYENKSKLEYIGEIPSAYDEVPLIFDEDGTVTAPFPKDKGKEKELNAAITLLKERLKPVVSFIKEDIFDGDRIKSQELVVDYEHNILAVCDLSSEKAVLEIKTTNSDSEVYKEQIFYESNGRECYHLKMDWQRNNSTYQVESIIIYIYRVDVRIGIPPSENWTERKSERRRLNGIAKLQEKIKGSNVEIVNYISTHSPIKLRCKICKNEWEVSYSGITKKLPQCPLCNPTVQNIRIKEKKSTDAERQKLRQIRYEKKVAENSSGMITVSKYKGSKENVVASCIACGYIWNVRADHLLERCYCPKCAGR